jgi:hypothetical protein
MYLRGKASVASENFWKYCASTAAYEPFVLQVKDLEKDFELPSTCKGCSSRLFTKWYVV